MEIKRRGNKAITVNATVDPVDFLIEEIVKIAKTNPSLKDAS